MHKAVEGALERLPNLPEWQDPSVLAREQARRLRREPARGCIIRKSRGDIAPKASSPPRLAYDELLVASTGAAADARENAPLRRAREHKGAGRLAAAIEAALPFALTGAQKRALAEICADLAIRQAHAAAVAGRCRLRQDRRRGAGHGACGRGRASGGADGADRNSGAPAFRAARAAGRRRGSAPSRFSPGARGGRAARGACARKSPPARRDIVIGTHALVQDDVAFARSRPRGGRRAASLRRASASGARRKGRGGGRAGHDRDADSAHAGAGLFRRHGQLRRSTKSRRAARPSTRARCRVAHRRSGRRAWARAREPARASIGSARWSRGARTSISPPREERAEDLRAFSATRVGLVHGRMKGADKDAAMEAFQARRDAHSRRHHGDRGRRRRAGGDDHGDRTRRALRPRAIASVARARRARLRRNRPASCSTRGRSARPPGRGSRCCARPRTASASPKRICACAARAKCWARGNPACRASGSPISTPTRGLLAAARDDAELILRRDPDLTSERGQALRVLLYLFERDEAVKLLRAG